MKNILTIALVLASTLATAGTLSAQDYKIQANVPFSFTVGDRTLPAGTYTIGSNPSTPDVLIFSNWAKSVTVATVRRANQSNPEQANSLVFHKYGNRYYLSQIRSEGASVNVDLADTKAEKRARRQAEEEVPTQNAQGSAGAPILIALHP
jgi:hypothetical protein